MVDGSGMSGGSVELLIGDSVSVRAGLVPAIPVLLMPMDCKGVDARHKAGHDGVNFAQFLLHLHRCLPRDDTISADASYSLSTIVTLAMPPPSHMVWRP